MRDFILLFDEKEGTSPIMHLLDNFPQVTVVRQIKSGWEPFDNHNCGAMPLEVLQQCLSMVFGGEPVDMDRLNRLYMKTATRPLLPILHDSIVGFKMRFIPPDTDLPVVGKSALVQGWKQRRYLGLPLRRLGCALRMSRFQRMMMDLIKEHDVVVFVAARQDVLRWGLSKYHGNGFGKPGHLQFKLANGTIRREDIPTIHVNCRRLEKVISACEAIHERKKALLTGFRQAGISAYPLLYEDFVSDNHKFFHWFFRCLQTGVTDEQIAAALDRGACYEKVHSDEISDFVVNHEEVLERFHGRFVKYEPAEPKHPSAVPKVVRSTPG